MKALLQLRRYLKPYLGACIAATLLLAGMVTMDLAIPRLTQRIIDEGITAQNQAVIWQTALLMIGAALVGAILSIGNTILAVRVSLNMAADLRSDVVRHVQTFSFGNLDRIQTGQLLVRTTSDVTQVQQVVLEFLRLLIRLPMWLAGSVVMLTLTSARLGLMMVVLLPLISVIIWFFATRSQRLFLLVQQRLDRLNQVLQENLAGVRVVKAFVRNRYESQRFDRANVALQDQTIGVIQFLATLLPTMQVTINLGIAGVVWFGGLQVVDGELTTGALIAAVNYLLSSMVPMLILGRVVGPVAAAGASAGRILEVLNEEPDVREKPRAAAPPPGNGTLVFEDVSFSYRRDGSEPVLKNLSFRVEAGQTVAILGATGSGKSTLVHLIPRFYDVTAGRITLDGVDIRDWPLETLRYQISLALQEPILFAGTLRDNICYGRAEASETEMIEAAQAAQAHDFISSFPDGYDSIIGQRGVTLSGGQKQRVSIARALLVKPRLLILDDSTSAVDVETETHIQNALENLRHEAGQRLTSIVIAQRISTVLTADNILVLDQGRIAAEGTHQNLLKNSPIYREIYDSQLGEGIKDHG